MIITFAKKVITIAYSTHSAALSSFGTGKVNALGGFSGTVLLVVFALLMVGESFNRLISPVEIVFNQAIFVAVVGLFISGRCPSCAWVILVLGFRGLA
jgi:Co/Zn/Cd efflux system component